MYKALKGYKTHWKKGDLVGLQHDDAKKFVEDGYLKLLTPEEERLEFAKLKEETK